MTDQGTKAFAQRCCLLVAAVFAAGMLAGCGKGGDKESTVKTKSAPGPIEKPAMKMAPAKANSTACIVEVEGKKLLEGELESQIDRLLLSRRMDGLPPAQLAQERARMREAVVEAFVSQHVLLKEADKQGIKADEADVTRMINDIKTRSPEGVPFEQFLVSCGTTLPEFTSDVENELRIEKLLAPQTSSVPVVTEAEAETFYKDQPSLFEAPESVHARHVLIGCSPDATDATKAEKKALAESTRKRLLEGADFAAVAKECSDCTSKEQGGDLGTFSRGKTVKEFEEAAFSQETNAIGPVVESRYGYHIIQVLQHDKAGKKAFEEVKSELMAFLGKKKQQENVSLYIEGLKQKAQIKYGAEPQAAAAPSRPGQPPAAPKMN